MTVNLDYERKHLSFVKDMNEERKQYRPTIKAPKGCGRAFGLYLQDEASGVYVDKYGLEKGIKAWMGAIDFGGGAMFAGSQKITDEKYAMLQELGQTSRQYWDRSYLSIWKEWKEKCVNRLN